MSQSAAASRPADGPGIAERAHDPRLEGLRGAAILLVMLYHTTHYGFARSSLDVAATVPTVDRMVWGRSLLRFVRLLDHRHPPSNARWTSLLSVVLRPDALFGSF